MKWKENGEEMEGRGGKKRGRVVKGKGRIGKWKEKWEEPQ